MRDYQQCQSWIMAMSSLKYTFITYALISRDMTYFFCISDSFNVIKIRKIPYYVFKHDHNSSTYITFILFK